MRRDKPAEVDGSNAMRDTDSPIWVGVQHFLNLFLLIFIIRSGVQILTDHPRLYWTRHSTPGRDCSGARSRFPKTRCGPPRKTPSACRDRSVCLFAGDFEDYRLRVSGLIDKSVELDSVQLRALPHQEQITQHFCIQGWSGVAKWGGVSMQTIIDLVKPQPEAKWVVFYSLGDGPDGGVYYDAHPIDQMSYHLTMLAYDMNGEPLSYGHGAPLRLRNEVQLGFKQVKWIKGVEFIADFSEIGGGYGGYDQDHEFFGYRQSI